MEDAGKTKDAPSLFQRRLSMALLGLLALIGSLMLWRQSLYNPATWREQPSVRSAHLPGQANVPTGLVPLSSAERYNAETLSDKINGKADLYLSAGFRSLESRRFSLPEDKTRWMEQYVYDMTGHPNAYAVYSIQRRSDVRITDITPHAYLSANGLFLVHGPFYVEIIGSEASETMQSQLRVLGEAFVKSIRVESGMLPELALFKPEHNGPQTIKLIADSAFGIEDLNWVYTSTYVADQSEATAFVAKRASASEAIASADAFIDFWNEYGAESIPVPDHLKGTRIVLILDNYEMAMVLGPYLFGVHEATHLDHGLAVLERLRQAIGEVVK